jgi:hypothetical protein
MLPRTCIVVSTVALFNWALPAAAQRAEAQKLYDSIFKADDRHRSRNQRFLPSGSSHWRWPTCTRSSWRGNRSFCPGPRLLRLSATCATRDDRGTVSRHERNRDDYHLRA